MPPRETAPQARWSLPRLHFGWRGALLIFAFWTFAAVVVWLNLMGLHGLRRTGTTPLALAVYALLGAYWWALLAVPLFHVTAALRRVGGQHEWRAPGMMGLVALSLVLPFLTAIVVPWVSLRLLDPGLGPRLLERPDGWVIMFRYRIAVDVLACQVTLVAGIAYDYFLRYRARLDEASLLRERLAEGRMRLLQAQLNPHFLHNTLHAVAALVESDPKGVRRMIALLSEFFRDILNQDSPAEVPLRQELELLERYLTIMSVRFGPGLQTSVAVEPGIQDALVPYLILQPLVENSLKYGVDVESHANRIDVFVRRQGKELSLVVRDTGNTPKSLGEYRPTGGSGFGLRQTRRRLAELYEDMGTFSLARDQNGGTVAEVKIPYHTSSAAVDPRDRLFLWEDRSLVGPLP